MPTNYFDHNAVSYSVLKRLLGQSPAHCRVPVAPTPAMAFGQAFHCLVLEPGEFEARYHMVEATTRTTKSYKASVDRHPEKTLLLESELETLNAMAKAVRQHAIVSQLMEEGTAEVECYWQDPQTQLDCKAKLDWVNPLLACIVDLKTTADASFTAFQRAVSTYYYHLQQVMYQTGARHAMAAEMSFVFVVVEKTPPYGVACYELSPEWTAWGATLLAQGLESYAACRIIDLWPGYPEHIQSLPLPAWMR